MKIRTRDGTFEVVEIRKEYYLGSNIWITFYVVRNPKEKCPELWPEHLVLEIVDKT